MGEREFLTTTDFLRRRPRRISSDGFVWAVNDIVLTECIDCVCKYMCGIITKTAKTFFFIY